MRQAGTRAAWQPGTQKLSEPQVNEHFEVGDQVRIIKDLWPGFSNEAVIWEDYNPHGTGAGLKAHERGSYGIRIEGFDYGPNKSNCHTVGASAIELSLNQEEVDEAVASILQVMRSD